MARIRNKPTRLKLGSRSTGTLKPEDLIPVLLDVTKEVVLHPADRHTVIEMKWRWEKVQKDRQSASTIHIHTGDSLQAALDRAANGDSEELSEIQEMLDTILNRYVPDFCYFGMSPGNNADIGVWVDDTVVPFHGPATDEIGKGDCLPSASVVKRDYWLKVNDHGNCTLYRKRRRGRSWDWQEVWSIV